MSEIASPKKAYRAICFDLDGTLLPMDIEEFMSEYFRRIAKYAAAYGLDAELFMQALKAGTGAMAMNDSDTLARDVFWAEFAHIYSEDKLREAGMSLEDVEAMANEFYENDFGHIGDGLIPNPLVAKAVKTLSDKGYPLLLTTMPMFPLKAVQHRLSWAGVDPAVFERITNYENSKYVKPRQTYYAENLAAMGLRGEDVLMVGNNTLEDLSFMDLGADAFLITDWLLNPNDFDVEQVRHGSFEDFAAWCETLPECADPVVDVAAGAVSYDDMQNSYDDNIIRDIDDADIQSKAKALAKDIARH